MTTFLVRFIRTVHAATIGQSGNDVYLKRDIALPFVPFPGLTIESNTFDLSVPTVSENPYAICWVMPDHRFEIEVKGDRRAARGEDDLAEIVQCYLDTGWEVFP
jgi:hypothetical protein